jgi:nitrate/nitrite transporter NarK
MTTPQRATPTLTRRSRSSTERRAQARIARWNPEDDDFWRAGGAAIARRNVICSVFTEHIGFAVWTMWSTLVLLPGPQYGLTPDQKFTLVSVPAALGSALRLPYSLAVARWCCPRRCTTRCRCSSSASSPCSSPRARRRTGAVIGIAGAIGAFGGVLVNIALRQSFLHRHDGNAAHVIFVCFHAVCALVTRAVYRRPRRIAIESARGALTRVAVVPAG